MKKALPLALGISMFAVSGCGLLFVEGPPSTIPEDATSVRCTESKTLPILDGVWATLNIIGSYVLQSQHDALKREIESQPRGATSFQVEESRQFRVGIIGGVLQWGVFGLSAIRGQKKVSACRDAVDMIEMRNR